MALYLGGVFPFVKKDILDLTDTMSKLANLNVLNKDNHKLASSIDIGFAAKGTLTNLAKKSSVSDQVLLEFRMDCTKFLSHLTSKLLERSPLKYKLVRRLFCLNPKRMVKETEECTKAFEDVLSKLIETKWRSSTARITYWISIKASLKLQGKTVSLNSKIVHKGLILFYIHTSKTRKTLRVFGVYSNFCLHCVTANLQ